MRVLLILAVAWLLGTRCSAPPELPPDFTWIRWSNAVAGYALEVPDAYAADVEEGGNAVYFRWGRTVPAKVYVTDLETARGWGLWPGHEPIADTVLAGLPAKMYGYVHCDGPFCSRIESFVAQRDGCWLGASPVGSAPLGRLCRVRISSLRRPYPRPPRRRPARRRTRSPILPCRAIPWACRER